MAQLERKFGFWGVFCIAAGAMISSGLFVLPGLAFAKAGPAMILAYALAGVMVIPAMLSKAELATAMPKSG
ncbi:MAG: amino acid permease, partial [Phycisphaerae bacterium]|nr:amino acid permease [Phycisphaerae bacterium]